MKKKLYVGCGLTLAPEKFKQDVELLKDTLRTDWHVLDFLGLAKGTAQDVYERAIIENVGNCDAFLAIADEPSIGLGYEMGVAVELHQKPVLAVADHSAKVTRMLLGAAEVHPNLSFATYHNLVQDVPSLAKRHFMSVLGHSS